MYLVSLTISFLLEKILNIASSIKKEDPSLEQLANSLRIEEEFCKQEENKFVSNVNVVEESQSKKRNYTKIIIRRIKRERSIGIVVAQIT